MTFGLASARAETRAFYGGAAQGALDSAPVELDPLAPGAGDAEVAALVFDTLFRVDGAGRARPHLALALEVDKAQPTHARLRLRPDVRLHDGTPLRARDVAASLARALREPGGWTLAPLRAARAAADDVVELELARPAPDLPLLLATPAASVVAGPRDKPLGTGPFRVESAAGGVVHLAAHAACFAGRPYLDSLVLRAFGSRAEETGAYDVGALQAARHVDRGSRGLAVESPATLTTYLAFGRDLRDDVAGPLRAALAVGLDRDKLRHLVRPSSLPAGAPAPPALGGAATRPAYDPAAARALLDGSPAAHAKVTLLVDRSRFEDQSVANRVLSDLARLELDVTVEAVDAAAYQQRLAAGRYELLLGTSAPPAPDGGLAELALLAAVDPAAARAALARAPAQAGATDFRNARVLPLFHRAARVQHPAELRGVTVDAAGRASWAEANWRK